LDQRLNLLRCKKFGDLISGWERVSSVNGKKYDIPENRIGDLILISEEKLTFGTTFQDHDLSLLEEHLRSHGGITEQAVPFILNKRIHLPEAPELRNFHAFYYARHAASI